MLASVDGVARGDAAPVPSRAARSRRSLEREDSSSAGREEDERGLSVSVAAGGTVATVCRGGGSAKRSVRTKGGGAKATWPAFGSSRRASEAASIDCASGRKDATLSGRSRSGTPSVTASQASWMAPWGIMTARTGSRSAAMPNALASCGLPTRSKATKICSTPGEVSSIHTAACRDWNRWVAKVTRTSPVSSRRRHEPSRHAQARVELNETGPARGAMGKRRPAKSRPSKVAPVAVEAVASNSWAATGAAAPPMAMPAAAACTRIEGNGARRPGVVIATMLRPPGPG